MTQTVDRDHLAEPMLPRLFRVVAKEAETPDTVTLTLEDPNGSEIPFSPGQFMMVYVFGVGEVPLSIASSPRAIGRLEHTIRGVGAVTNALCSLQPDDVVGLRGPYGTSWPLEEAFGMDLLVVTGGIGLAPLRPAVIEALHRREQIKNLALLYGARTPTDLLYKDELLGWESTPSINVETTVDPYTPAETVAFVCGPEVMMRAVARELRGDGVPAQNIWISMERNMKCGIGFCGHCQYGKSFLCRTGPVGRYADFADRMTVDEV